MTRLCPLFAAVWGAALLLAVQPVQAQSDFTAPPVNADDNATILIPDTLAAYLGGGALAPGDRIGAFVNDTTCVGAATYPAAGAMAFPINGSGETYPGHEPGEAINFKVEHDEAVYSVEARYQPCEPGDPVCQDDGRYAKDRVYTLAALEAERTLPVELASFTVQVEARHAVLAWQTTGEERNADFEVQQKALDAPVGTASGWTETAFVEGAGTTQETQRYRHRTAPLAPGRYAFRLRQVDFDGSDAYSTAEHVRVRLQAKARLAPAYPNPFRTQARFSLTVAHTQPVHVALFDVLGRRVARLHDGELAGGQKHTFSLNARDLSSGQYFIRARGDSFSKTQAVTLAR